MNLEIPDRIFRCPDDLAVTPTGVRRVLIVGQCLLAGWSAPLKGAEPGAETDFVLFNNAQELASAPPRPVEEYDFQIVGVPLRGVAPDREYFRLKYDDIEGYTKLFDDSVQRMRRFLASAMRWNREHGVLTFVVNFLLPQQNPMGRLLPRYDLRNFVYFVERLNEALAVEVAKSSNAYFFDFDAVLATYGRRYTHEDVLMHVNHGAMLVGNPNDKGRDRLEPLPLVNEVYPVRPHNALVLAWTELLAMYRTVRQLDMVKLVITDIDDTLWRGVGVERTSHGAEEIEGWPLGYVEALCQLKRRGVLLALLSKNEERLIAPIWRRLFGGRLEMDDFAVRRINWRPKAENFGEILDACNLTPRNVVFIDDNPVEREAIVAGFPGVRAIGANPLLWRRILLWSSETQVAHISHESAKRTELVKSQIERDGQREAMPREEFLASLNVEIELRTIRSISDPGFSRALELTNKSNQFNTTGRRWTLQDIQADFDDGLELMTFEVTDRFTNYGSVGVVFIRGAHIIQYLMSCRVVGLEVEVAVIAKVLERIAGATGADVAHADLKETELNLLARDLWSRCGFSLIAGLWTRDLTQALPIPKHIHVVGEEAGTLTHA